MADTDRAPLFAEGSGSTLALVGYLTVAVVLMVADRRGGYLERLRSAFLDLSTPLYQIAEWPSRLGGALSWHLHDRSDLQRRNRELGEELLNARAELSQLRARDAEASRIRTLVDFASQQALQGQVARVIDVDLDPFSHRILLDKGSADGIAVGAVLFDGLGIAGQIVDLGRTTAVALLVSHPEHGVPVEVERSGVRAIAYGTGSSERLSIDDLPLSADVREGDVVRSSGMGGRFPIGFMVGTVSALERDPGAAFARAILVPAARLRQARELMILPPVRFELPAPAAALLDPQPAVGAAGDGAH